MTTLWNSLAERFNPDLFNSGGQSLSSLFILIIIISYQLTFVSCITFFINILTVILYIEWLSNFENEWNLVKNRLKIY